MVHEKYFIYFTSKKTVACDVVGQESGAMAALLTGDR
jgi:hypothetical protein